MLPQCIFLTYSSFPSPSSRVSFSPFSNHKKIYTSGNGKSEQYLPHIFDYLCGYITRIFLPLSVDWILSYCDVILFGGETGVKHYPRKKRTNFSIYLLVSLSIIFCYENWPSEELLQKKASYWVSCIHHGGILFADHKCQVTRSSDRSG